MLNIHYSILDDLDLNESDKSHFKQMLTESTFTLVDFQQKIKNIQLELQSLRNYRSMDVFQFIDRILILTTKTEEASALCKQWKEAFVKVISDLESKCSSFIAQSGSERSSCDIFMEQNAQIYAIMKQVTFKNEVLFA